jgi:predicted nucleotidyltransferase
MNKIKTRKELTDKEIISLLKKHKDLLKKYKVKRIGLFGSYVSGEQRRRSDIDFLVEFKESTFDNFMGLVFDLEAIFGKKVELITNGSLSPYIQPYVEREVRWYEA